ncbi:hypothetical protein ACFW9L_16125 [Streptomyces sp. NPDC059517]|uniref:hypothetical protein n=1 Tax=Streptomyces sp. NPDC059517 TaxID=3346855 RepID=UPI0036986A6F
MVATYWAELAPQTVIDTAGYGPPPVPPQGSYGQSLTDQGYGGSAAGFSVNSVCVFVVGTNTQRWGYYLITPGNTVLPAPGQPFIPANPQLGPACIPAPAAAGAGIWKIEVVRLPNSPVLPPSPPGPTPDPPMWSNGITFVELYNAAQEGILVVDFDGQETVTERCPSIVQLTALVEVTPGSGTFQPAPACVEPGRLVRLEANVTPAGLSGLSYRFDFGDGTKTPYTPQNYADHAYAVPSPARTCSVIVWKTESACQPVDDGLQLRIDCCAPAGRPPTYWDPGQQRCTDCPDTGGLTLATTDPPGCAPTSTGAATLTATPPPGSPQVTYSYSWSVDGPAHLPTADQIHARAVSNTPTISTSAGWTGTGTTGGAVNLNVPPAGGSGAGVYAVAVVASPTNDAHGCPSLQAGTTFAVRPCEPCPDGTVWDPLQAKCVGSQPPTTPPPTTPPPTTPPPTTTPAPPPSGGGGCLCTILLLLALALIAAAAAALLTWACGGYASGTLLTAGTAGGTAGLLALGAWVLLCGGSQCSAVQLMISYFTMLIGLMTLFAALLALLGLLSCAVGALLCGVLFSAVLATLYSTGSLVGCVSRPA